MAAVQPDIFLLDKKPGFYYTEKNETGIEEEEYILEHPQRELSAGWKTAWESENGSGFGAGQ